MQANVVEELMVHPGEPAGLGRRSTSECAISWLTGDGASTQKELAEQDLESFRVELSRVQELLYATQRYALLVILQALDAAGKDGTIKHVMSGVNPQGCEVTSFKQPSPLELEHDFLWRCSNALPERGHIGIFNRSYYEEVLVVRVHPEILAGENLPPGTAAGEKLWSKRYEDINAFEHHLHRNGTRIVKLFLHVSKQEQKKRLLARLDDPGKYYKFSAADVGERAYFEDYQKAYEAAITATSTSWAPWYVIPADHKYVLRALVGGILTRTIDALDLQLPEVGPQALADIEAARRQLLAD
ncbi:MAG: polyphosphate kinase 2 family protein [Acidimicrobiales bacterium]